MKTIFILFSFLCLSQIGYAQNSCEDLKDALEENASQESSRNCFGSTALVKVEYYTYEGKGFVIAYLKSYSFDGIGKAYVYCGISQNRWSRFISEGQSGSWGKAFTAYIVDYKCDCY